MPPSAHDTLFYDGHCPLCSFEMDHLRQLKSENLVLQDIHSEPDLLDGPPEQYLKVLHLKRRDGSLLTGLDASVHAWQHTSFGPFVAWLRWPVIRTIADAVYKHWARKRFDKRYR